MGEISNPGLDESGFDLTQFYAVFFEEARENLANRETMLLDIDTSRPTVSLCEGVGHPLFCSVWFPPRTRPQTIQFTTFNFSLD